MISFHSDEIIKKHNKTLIKGCASKLWPDSETGKGGQTKVTINNNFLTLFSAHQSIKSAM